MLFQRLGPQQPSTPPPAPAVFKNWTDNAISDNNSSLPLHYKQFCRWILFCSKTSPRELFFHSILHRWNILKVGFHIWSVLDSWHFFCDGRGFKKDYSSVEPNVSKENYKRCKNKKSEEIVTRKWDLDYTELFLMETKNDFSRIWIQVNSWRKTNQ